jgi:hypothetical protein
MEVCCEADEVAAACCAAVDVGHPTCHDGDKNGGERWMDVAQSVQVHFGCYRSAKMYFVQDVSAKELSTNHGRIYTVR